MNNQMNNQMNSHMDKMLNQKSNFIIGEILRLREPALNLIRGKYDDDEARIILRDYPDVVQTIQKILDTFDCVEYPEVGECGRCGEDNGKGGTHLWADLCDDCDEHECPCDEDCE